MSRNERIILFLSVGSALMILAILFQRLAGWSDRHGEVVAIVAESRNDVRYRSSDEFIWSSARKKLNVINEDQFFVGEKSSLVINTIDGGKLQFSENSMVVIKVYDGKVGAELLLGEGQTVGLIKANVISRQTSSTPTVAATAKQEALKLELTKPPEPPPPPPPPPPEPVKPPEPAPVVQAPKPKQIWTSAESVRADVEQVTAREMLKGGASKVRIEWAASPTQKPVRVMIKDLQGRVVKLLSTNDNHVDWVGAPAGAYQVFVERYQVPVKKANSADGGSAVFEVQALKKIALGRPTFPEPNQTILRSPSGFSLPIQTKPTADGLETQVEFSRSKRFEQVEFKEIFGGTSYVLREPLPEGVWYFRTRTIGEFGLSNWSEPSRFQILDQ